MASEGFILLVTIHKKWPVKNLGLEVLEKSEHLEQNLHYLNHVRGTPLGQIIEGFAFMKVFLLLSYNVTPNIGE